MLLAVLEPNSAQIIPAQNSCWFNHKLRASLWWKNSALRTQSCNDICADEARGLCSAPLTSVGLQPQMAVHPHRCHCRLGPQCLTLHVSTRWLTLNISQICCISTVGDPEDAMHNAVQQDKNHAACGGDCLPRLILQPEMILE